MEDYERVLLSKNEVFVFSQIPPRSSNRGYRAADWDLEKPEWVGRLRIVATGKNLALKLEDKITGELFAKCPIESYPSPAVESVLDSSRYFVIRIQDEGGRKAFIGMGFSDRGDSFDLSVAMQDHFKWLRNEQKGIDEAAKPFDAGPKLDLGFKEGETIKINIGIKRPDKRRPKPQSGGGIGLPPPPPGGVRIPGPPRPGESAIAQPTALSDDSSDDDDDFFGGASSGQNSVTGGATTQNLGSLAGPGPQQDLFNPAPSQPNKSSGVSTDLLGLDIGAPPTMGAVPLAPQAGSGQQFQAPPSNDPWGDFASAGPVSNTNTSTGGDPWVQF